MAERGSWPSIRKYGLKSTSALLDFYHIAGEYRRSIESCWRPESVTLEDPNYGKAVIRDQKPLHEGALKRVLIGMSTTEWYQLLNRKTFFWVTRERLERLLKARAYRYKPQTVIIIESSMLVNRHGDKITVSPINSGATFGGGMRGRNTFSRLPDYDFETAWRKKKKDAIVELAVDYTVDDIADMVLTVEEWYEGKIIKKIQLQSM